MMAENVGGKNHEIDIKKQIVDGSRMAGKQSIAFKNPPYIIAGSSMAGKKEGEGPLGELFDQVFEAEWWARKPGRKQKAN